MDENLKTLQAHEQDYALQKEAFEKWTEQNAASAHLESYAQYVEQFRGWEKAAIERIKELRAAVARKPIAPEPEVPNIDLNTQLENVLADTTAPQFILAFMTMAQKDPTFLKKAFEVVMEECRATGYANPILPQKTINASRSTPALHGYHHHQQHQSSPRHTTAAAHLMMQSAASPASSSSGIYLPTHPGGTTSLLSTRYGGGGGPIPSLASASYTQMTPYGAIPEGWTVDPAIRKQPPKPASPAREYKSPLNLPFKDFSQT